MKMPHVPGLLRFFALALPCTAALGAGPVPIDLSGVTSIGVLVKRCDSAPQKHWELNDETLIAGVLAELESVRRQPVGIYAAKIGCSSRVSFFRGADRVTSIDVFSCELLEKAPVSGKRYFRYARGANNLPQLRNIAGITSQGPAC